MIKTPKRTGTEIRKRDLQIKIKHITHRSIKAKKSKKDTNWVRQATANIYPREPSLGKVRTSHKEAKNWRNEKRLIVGHPKRFRLKQQSDPKSRE